MMSLLILIGTAAKFANRRLERKLKAMFEQLGEKQVDNSSVLFFSKAKASGQS